MAAVSECALGNFSDFFCVTCNVHVRASPLLNGFGAAFSITRQLLGHVWQSPVHGLSQFRLKVTGHLRFFSELEMNSR
jgi:hypothetical protein